MTSKKHWRENISATGNASIRFNFDLPQIYVSVSKILVFLQMGSVFVNINLANLSISILYCKHNMLLYNINNNIFEL